LHHLNAGGSLILDVPRAIDSKPIVTINLKVSRQELTPDHYVGDVEVRIPGKDEPLKIPLEVNVRTGPELPILILLLGIAFGRLVKYMQDKGTPQSDLLLQLFQIEARARQMSMMGAACSTCWMTPDMKLWACNLRKLRPTSQRSPAVSRCSRACDIWKRC
jgi:hypothetical protein